MTASLIPKKKRKMGPFELVANANGAKEELNGVHEQENYNVTRDKYYAILALDHFRQAEKLYREAAGGDNFASERAARSAAIMKGFLP